ncbi:MAG: hypothetical protein AB8E15_05550 [Bdellovibrionales bacterium]
MTFGLILSLYSLGLFSGGFCFQNYEKQLLNEQYVNSQIINETSIWGLRLMREPEQIPDMIRALELSYGSILTQLREVHIDGLPVTSLHNMRSKVFTDRRTNFTTQAYLTIAKNKNLDALVSESHYRTLFINAKQMQAKLRFLDHILDYLPDRYQDSIKLVEKLVGELNTALGVQERIYSKSLIRFGSRLDNALKDISKFIDIKDWLRVYKTPNFVTDFSAFFRLNSFLASGTNLKTDSYYSTMFGLPFRPRNHFQKIENRDSKGTMNFQETTMGSERSMFNRSYPKIHAEMKVDWSKAPEGLVFTGVSGIKGFLGKWVEVKHSLPKISKNDPSYYDYAGGRVLDVFREGPNKILITIVTRQGIVTTIPLSPKDTRKIYIRSYRNNEADFNAQRWINQTVEINYVFSKDQSWNMSKGLRGKVLSFDTKFIQLEVSKEEVVTIERPSSLSVDSWLRIEKK